MERLKDLITQLKEQFDRKAEPSQMLETARLLEAELRFLASQPAPAKVMPTKIAVMMPSAAKIYTPSQSTAPTEQRKETTTQPVELRKEPATQLNGNHPDGEQERGKRGEVKVEPAAPLKPEPTGPLEEDPDYRYKPAPVSAPTAKVTEPGSGKERGEKTEKGEKSPDRGVWPFDPLAEKPRDRFTLSQKAREVNDVIGANGSSSLNDKLRSEVSDLKSALNETPVRDLKKAIGVNDRYVFINQLFRGDEVMYERSIKTINGFRILPEAEYWMERELKVKLGWDENNPVTRHFYLLVKRRFS
jgi:hypothetical protein